MRTQHWTILIGLVFLGLAILILRPVPLPDEKDCLSLKGVVVEIYEAGVKDVVFRLQGQNRTYYVNRGLQRGLDLGQLRSTLTNREVTIKYPKYWTPLDPFNSVRHISKIEHEGRTLFTELE